MLRKSEKGQGLLEYIIISGLIGILCLATVKTFGDTLKTKIKKMKESVNQNIEID